LASTETRRVGDGNACENGGRQAWGLPACDGGSGSGFAEAFGHFGFLEGGGEFGEVAGHDACEVV